MKNFSIAELSRSDTAAARGIDNTPNFEQRANLVTLIETVLDPLRERWGRAIRVNSGYRCPELNKVVGGVKNSQHLTGEAADINAGSPAENRKLFALIREMKLPFDQLIDEANMTWVHVSHKRAGANRGEVLSL